MVAYTPTYCLPYFEGTDSPCVNTGSVCEPSTVWCDFITLVDTAMTALDDLGARFGEVVPIAQVSYNPDTPVVVSGEIPFDTVDLDNDDMVNLTLFQGIVPNRNGVYLIDAMAVYDTPANDDRVRALIITGDQLTGNYATAGAIASLTTRGGGAAATRVRGSMMWPYSDASPIPRTITVSSLYTSRPLISATLTVSWHSDVA